MKVVLDSNVLLASISKFSPYRPIFTNLIEGKFVLALSHDVLLEYHEVVTRFSSADVARNITEFLLATPFVQQIQVYYRWNLIATDPDDNKFVDLSIAANADYLVSNDRHFSNLESLSFPRVHVISAAAFLSLLLNTHRP